MKLEKKNLFKHLREIKTNQQLTVYIPKCIYTVISNNNVDNYYILNTSTVCTNSVNSEN